MNKTWKPITIATFTQPIEAELARTVLESEGIHCFIADSNTIGMNPLYSGILGGVKLQVNKDDEQRAREILDSTECATQLS